MSPRLKAIISHYKHSMTIERKYTMIEEGYNYPYDEYRSYHVNNSALNRIRKSLSEKEREIFNDNYSSLRA